MTASLRIYQDVEDDNMSLIRMASNAAMVMVKSSQVYRVPPVSQGNQGERSQQEKKGQEELRSGNRHSPWQ